MVDDRAKASAQDPARVGIAEEHAVRSRAKEPDVGDDDLSAAAKVLGPSVLDAEQHQKLRQTT
jgi:hypothetical protein